jgi:replicative DNA helicase
VLEKELADGIEKMKEDTSLLNYSGDDRIITSYEAKEVFDKLRAEAGKGLFCNIPSLMESIGGSFRTGTLTGHPGQGKTLLACSLTNAFEFVGKKSVWISLEMGFNILERFSVIPEFYMPKENASMTVQWVRQRIKEAVLKYKVEAVFIDNLGYLETAEKVQWRGNSLLLGDMVRFLSRVSKEFNVAIFLIAHTKDTQENKLRPGMEDIRDSGYISREADYILAIWRQLCPDTDPKDKVYTDFSMISLEKNRFTGKTHQCRVLWNRNASVFEEK